MDERMRKRMEELLEKEGDTRMHSDCFIDAAF